MNKKSLAIVAVLMVLVSVLSIFATIAYLQDTSNTVHNTFTSGNVSIKLDETNLLYDADRADEDGYDVQPRTEDGNNYFALPGQSYTKDPMVTVKAGSEASYVGMKVVVNNADVFSSTDVDNNAIFAGNTAIDVNNFLTSFTNYNANTSVWKLTASVGEGNTFVYYFVKEAVVAQSNADTQLDKLFTEVKIPGTFDNAQMDAIKDTMEIDVTGYAVQQTGFNDAYTALSTAFDDTHFAQPANNG